MTDEALRQAGNPNRLDRMKLLNRREELLCEENEADDVVAEAGLIPALSTRLSAEKRASGGGLLSAVLGRESSGLNPGLQVSCTSCTKIPGAARYYFTRWQAVANLLTYAPHQQHTGAFPLYLAPMTACSQLTTF